MGLATKQDSLIAGTGLTFSGNTLNTYQLKWDTTNTPATIPDCLIFNDFSVSQNLNLGTNQYELIVTSPVSTSALNSKQDLISDFTQTTPTPTIILAPMFDANTDPNYYGQGTWIDNGDGSAT